MGNQKVPLFLGLVQDGWGIKIYPAYLLPRGIGSEFLRGAIRA